MPDSVKKDRIRNRNDIVQSSRGGILSKEFIELYGTDKLNVTPEQIKNAKYVWKGETSISAYKGERNTNL